MADLTFSSFLQGPLGEAIEAVDTMGALPAPQFRPSISLKRSGSAAPQLVRGPDLGLLGPGDVKGLTPGTVIRSEPAPYALDVEPNYLACVEVQPAELPWVLTPARAATGRLRPWLVLVVVDAQTTQIASGQPLPTISAEVNQLPDLRDSWGWAHVQRSSGTPIARLICPRRLDPNVAYLACLVPAFASGRDAGLGKTPAADHQLAWDLDTDTTVQLPVYHHWTFHTGPEGDFERLVNRLGPADRDALRVSSTRPVDVRQPWLSHSALSETAQICGISGALQPFDDPPPSEPAAEPAVLEAIDTLLRAQLDAPAEALTNAPAGDETGTLAPPLYGARHVLQSRVGSDPAWIAALNTSFAHRIAAGLGATYVRVHQEELMAKAWEQVGEIREANRRRALVELSTAVAERVHDKHVTGLGDGELIAFTAPASARTRTSDTTTLSLELSMSTMTNGIATTAFARRLRPTSKLSRRTGITVQTIVGRAMCGEVSAPDQQPVLLATPESSKSAVSQVVSPAAAQQLMVITAMADVAQVNGVGGADLQSSLSPLGEELTTLSAAGNVQTLALQITDVISDVTSVTSGIFSAMTVDEAYGVITTQGIPLEVANVAGRVTTLLQPGQTHWSRLASQTVLPDGMQPPGSGNPVLAYPEFPVPTALALLRSDPEWFLPGLGAMPTNKVALLRQNSAFIESFLVGINHEMMRELLWREYPTDLRGTPFTRFWPRPDSGPDITPIHTWTDTASLGKRLLFDEEIVVLLVRGEVLRRYPDTIVTAVRSGAPDPDNRHRPNPAFPPLAPLFAIKVDPQTNAYAFKIREAELSTPASVEAYGWFFVFAENSARVRFGFDEVDPGTVPDFGDWNAGAWPPRDPDETVCAACVPFARGHALAGAGFEPPGGVSEPLWNRDAADIARITLQQPYRVAIQADVLLGLA